MYISLCTICELCRFYQHIDVVVTNELNAHDCIQISESNKNTRHRRLYSSSSVLLMNLNFFGFKFIISIKS